MKHNKIPESEHTITPTN